MTATERGAISVLAAAATRFVVMMQGSAVTLLCQLRSVVGVMLLAMVEGMGIGWASPAIPKMEKGLAPFKATDNDVSLIVSLFDIGVMLGAWFCTLVFSVAGRRQTVMVGPVTLTLWVALTAIGSSTGMLIAARLLAGCGMGITLSFSFIYVGEVTMASYRGPIILATTLLIPIGQLIAFLVGSYVDWMWQSLYPAPFVAAMAFCMVFLMEETPYYLAMKDKTEEMEQVLRRLRVGVPEEAIREEAASILRNVKQQRADATTWQETFSPPGVKKAAFLVFVESSSLALLGVTCVLAYTQKIFTVSKGDILNPTWSSVLVILVEIALIISAIYAIERLGRRVQLSLAALLACLSSLVLAAFFACMEIGKMDMSSWNWVPLVAVSAYIGAVGGGINTVPQVLMSELLSQRAKTFMAPICMTAMALSSFGINYAFLPVGTSSGFWIPFLFFGITNALIGLFTLLALPETKGKTLVEVQEMLSGHRGAKEAL